MSQSDFVSRGQALVAAGQFQEAVKVCRLGLLGRPTTVEGRVVLGQALLALKRYDEVLAEMRVALELDSTAVAAQVLRAEALLKKGDNAPAIEALQKARQAAPNDPRIKQLLAEAEQGSQRPSVTHPSVGFVGTGDTRHYPGHTSGAVDDDPAHYTQPTSLQSPGGVRRSSQRAAAVEPPRSGAMLSVGDRTGTMEVDPEAEGIEVPRDPDFDDDVAAPPGSKAGARPKRSTMAGKKSAQNKAVQPVAAKAVAAKAGPAGKAKFIPAPTQSLDVDDDDLEEVEETGVGQAVVPRGMRPENRQPYPSAKIGSTAVRDAVAMPSSVIGEYNPNERHKPASIPPPVRGKSATLPPPLPLPSAPPRNPIAAALPTVAAAQPPPPFVQQQAPYPPASLAAAARPTMAITSPQDGALSPAQQQTALAVEQIFGGPQQQPWNGAQPLAGDPRAMQAAMEPTARPGELDPQILALMSGGANVQSAEVPAPVAPMEQLAMHQVALQMPPDHPGMRTGVRKRSRLQITAWILVGGLVIGGGVFAGFKIRAMRLDKQIATARQHATDLAKSDTWSGWTAARDGLAGIVQASSTPANRAALARTRALIAYEFGDGVPEARTAVEALAGQGGLDGKVAVTFIALDKGDIKAARTAAEAAMAGSEGDAAAEYVSAEAALLAGDARAAAAAMKLAVEKEPRPLYGVGLARALAAQYKWDDAIAAIDKVRTGAPDHPGAAITRAVILSASGRIFPGSALGTEVKTQLEQIISEGAQVPEKQPRGVSPTQLAFANLALAQVELARGELAAARKAVRAATDVNLDDIRFAEETVATLYTLGELSLARSACEIALRSYPTSNRIKITYAQTLLAQGRATDAIDAIGKLAEIAALPEALAVRGNAYLALGDMVSAGSDFDAALKKLPTHEPSIVGRTWLELATGELETASKRIADRMSTKGASAAVTTAYAATLRRSIEPTQRDQARTLLDKVVASGGIDAVRAQLELARIYRDSGDSTSARAAYEKAAKNGGLEARFEGALLNLDWSKPVQGREALEKLLEEAGSTPSAQLVIETARARLLVGEHQLAADLLAIADKMASVERFKLDRERGRYAFRKSDFTGAATALGRAVDTCGGDAETFLLAADVAMIDNKSGLAEKVKKLAPERLKGRPEAQIALGKLAIAAGDLAAAEAAFTEAKAKLAAEKASNRRRAQADFGLAFINYQRENTAGAQSLIELVIDEDPTIVDAYMLAAENTKDKKKKYGFAKRAVQLNPDYAYAWLAVGQLAAELKDKRQLVDAIARLQMIAPQGDELKQLQKLAR